MDDNNTILRQIRLSLITNDNHPIIEWFNSIWGQLDVVEANTYHYAGGEFIYYLNNNGKKQWIFFQDDKKRRFWCNYNNYWKYLESFYGMDYDSISILTKLLVDSVLNSNIVTPYPQRSQRLFYIEAALVNKF